MSVHTNTALHEPIVSKCLCSLGWVFHLGWSCIELRQCTLSGEITGYKSKTERQNLPQETEATENHLKHETEISRA